MSKSSVEKFLKNVEKEQSKMVGLGTYEKYNNLSPELKLQIDSLQLAPEIVGQGIDSLKMWCKRLGMI